MWDLTCWVWVYFELEGFLGLMLVYGFGAWFLGFGIWVLLLAFGDPSGIVALSLIHI